MKRVLPVVLLLVFLAPSSAARGNGCPLPCSGQSASPPDSKLLYVQPEGESGPLIAYDTATRRQAFGFPAGRSSADGNWHFSAFPGPRTMVARYLLQSGVRTRSWYLPGRWNLAAVSPTGRWVALSRSRAARTDVSLVNAGSGRVAHVVRLRGRFEVETISANGKNLFLIEHLSETGAPRYLVRLYDVARERLAVQPLRSSGDPRVMAGLAWSGVGSPDGRWLLTLYLDTRRESAFIHALDLDRRSPRCIDLPSGQGEFAKLKRYALTLSPDGRRLYAANPALGVVTEIDLATRRVTKTAKFGVRGVQPGGAASLSGTISRNGRTLYFSGGRDLWAYDAAYGLVRGPYKTAGEVMGFGYGKNDRKVFALRKDGRMLAFDAATGRRKA